MLDPQAGDRPLIDLGWWLVGVGEPQAQQTGLGVHPDRARRGNTIRAEEVQAPQDVLAAALISGDGL